MRRFRLPMMLALMLFIGSIAAVSAQDGRINVVHHFGGDVLYCNQTDGCKLTNDQYKTLWTVTQATITKAISTACSTGQAQHIDAGKGTYGEFTIVAQCPNLLYLVGPDEWGKTNTMPFTTDYDPVSAPGGAVDEGRCQVDLAANDFESIDGIHDAVGFDIWQTDSAHNLITFLNWTASNPGLPACDVA